MSIINNLLCEHLKNPIGVEVFQPRLSWRMEDSLRGARQSAYRVMVASTPVKLSGEDIDLWDSGKVMSGDSVLIPYEGRKLNSRQRCFWRVLVWDGNDIVSASETAFWEMGLLNKSDWKAQWITGDTPKIYYDRPTSPILRKEFSADKPICSARAYVSGLGFYEFYLNGIKISDAVLNPAFTKYDSRVLYNVFDVTDYVTTGENAAGLMMGTGWYNHHDQDVWNLYAAPWRDECKALIQIELTFEDGSIKTVVSDDSWLYSTGPIVYDSLRSGEIYDAREEKDGWNELGCNTDDWKGVRITRPPGGFLHSQLMPPCRVTESLKPVSVKEVRPGVWVYDAGKNIAGWAKISVKGPRGTKIELRYAEKLGEDGDIDQGNINPFVKTDRFQTDTFILKGDGIESYEARFTYHGFQYIQLTGLTYGATIELFEARVVNTDISTTGSFECSNELFNSIQKAGIVATLGNYHGMPTDCPHREKNGWSGDAHLSGEQVLFNFGDEVLSAYTKWLDDFSDCQRLSGAFPGIVPTGGWGYNWGAGPAWDSAYILIPWYMYLYRGDLGILRRHYNGMKKYLDFLSDMSSGHIVKFGLGDWCPPSKGEESHKTPAELTNTAYYYNDVCKVAKIASLLGEHEDSEHFKALSKEIKSAARKKFFDKSKNQITGHSQTAISCFLYQGITEDEEAGLFGDLLLKEIEKCNFHIDCGILGTKYVLNVLTDLGYADVAYRIANQRDYPSWGLWIEQGATTLWEAWDGKTSRNHHMFSDISAWFYKTLAGICPDVGHAGFKHVIIKPWMIDDIEWVKSEIQTPYGKLKSSWIRENGRFSLEVCIPPNSSATIHLPTLELSNVLESGIVVSSAEKVSCLGLRQNRSVYAVESGIYRFEW